MTATTQVLLEQGKRWVFASALDWPGWCRRGKGEEAALAALLDYADRYAAVAGADFSAGELRVVERVQGTGTTDFGAPDARGSSDEEPLSPVDADRLAGLLERCWQAFDAVVQQAPAELRKGPRGGGRDRDAIVDHVREAERSYGRTIGVRLPPGTPWEEQRRPSPPRSGPGHPVARGRRATPFGASPGTCSTTPGRSRTRARRARCR